MGSVAHESSAPRAASTLRTAAWIRAAPLAGLVAGSFLLRLVLGRLRTSPHYFPDEYIYAALGRSIAHGGRPEIHGAAANFPALLQPLLTAPAWLAGDAGSSYRLVQAIGALAMSLAAVPAYLLARRLGLGKPISLAVAALTLAFPDLVYAGAVLSEPFAYPLALGAVAAGVIALAQPGRNRQLLFLGLAFLATVGRLELAALFVAFAVASVAIGLRERRLRAVLREQRLPLAALAALALLAFARGAGGLGIYASVLHPNVHPQEVVTSAGANLLVLGYASGWVLVPGALIGLGVMLVRPRSRLELSFAGFGAAFGGGILLEAALWGEPHLMQERYVFYVLPLAAISFGVYAARGWPLRRAHALVAASLLTVTARVPLSGFAVGHGKAHSPFLFAAWEAMRLGGGVASGSFVLAAGAAVLLLLAVAASTRPRAGTPLVLGLALTTAAAASVGAVSFDAGSARRAAADYLAPDRSWVDHARVGPVTFVRSPGTPGHDGIEQLFWNRSIERVVHLPGSMLLDQFSAEVVSVRPDGALHVGGRPLAGTLLLDDSAATLQPRGGHVVARTPNYVLWRPEGPPRLGLELRGRYSDGWLAPEGLLQLWPERPGEGVRGRFVLHLSAPAGFASNTIRLRANGVTLAVARVPTGRGANLSVALCLPGPARIVFQARKYQFVDGRLVSVRASAPVFRPDPQACPSSYTVRRKMSTSLRGLDDVAVTVTEPRTLS